MNYVRQHNELLIATRLRQLSHLFWENRQQIYQENGVQFKPNWGTVSALIQSDAGCTVSAIAAELGFAHTSVLKIVKDMTTKNYLIAQRDENDARRRILKLTELGVREYKKMERLSVSIERVNKNILAESGLIEALAKVEAKFDEASYYERFSCLSTTKKSDL